MSYNLQSNHHFNFTLVGFHLEKGVINRWYYQRISTQFKYNSMIRSVKDFSPQAINLQMTSQDFQGGKGFFFYIDKYIVEKVNRNQFVTHPRNPEINANHDVLVTLTFWVGLKSTSRFVKSFNYIAFLQETHPYVHQHLRNQFQ
jgi:hypothetical protein